MTKPPTPSRARPRPWRSLTLLAALIAVLVWVETARGARRVAHMTPAEGAQWIWASGEGRAKNPAPAAFLAVADVRLAAVPASASFAIVADEQYHLYVNERWIGSNVLGARATLDTYEVAPYLAPGNNRVVVELYSRRGAGGLLAVLASGDDAAPLLVTNADWRIVRHATPAVYHPYSAALAGEAPQVWGAPPTGRWRITRRTERTPLVPAYGQPTVVGPRRARCSGPECPCGETGCDWLRVDRHAGVVPAAAVGEITLFDWGRTVVGYPIVDLHGTDGAHALLATSDDAAELHHAVQELIHPVPGAAFWHSARPRAFRYLRVFGERVTRPPRLLLLSPEQAAQLVIPWTPWPGAFGLPAVERAPDPLVIDVARRVGAAANRSE